MNEIAANWQTIADFAAARGCSIRTVKRWIESGTVESQKDGARRLVRDQKEGHEGTQERDTEGHSRLEVGTEEGHKRTQKRDTEGTQAPSVETELRAQLDRAHAEISFLRNVVEAQQRDAVETRQALKRALDLAPKQLTEGATPEGQQSHETRAPTNDSHADQGAPQKPAKRDGEPITYDSIADELERRLGL